MPSIPLSDCVKRGLGLRFHNHPKVTVYWGRVGNAVLWEGLTKLRIIALPGQLQVPHMSSILFGDILVPNIECGLEG